MIKTTTRITALMAVVALAAFLSACGSSKSSSGTTASAGASTSASTSTPSTASTTATPSGGADAAIAALVPAAARSKGTLTIGTDPTYAPSEFVSGSGSTIVGFDIDLANAIVAKMGLRANPVRSTFDSIIPGLASGRYDLGVSSFTDTRVRERTVDFVTYFSAGTSFYTRASGGPTITDLGSLCGASVAAEKGTTQVADAQGQSRRCTAAGRKAVNVLVFPDQNGANLAISSGRASVGMADSPVAAYIVRQSNGQFRLSGTPYGTAPYGIPIPKRSGLDRAVLAAVRAVIADGSYMRILTKWGVQQGAITSPAINGATS